MQLMLKYSAGCTSINARNAVEAGFSCDVLRLLQSGAAKSRIE